MNERLYRENPTLPSVLGSGVRYLGFDPKEDWRNAAEVIASKKGDCEDLAAARAGELRARGEAGASAIVKRTGPKMTHALVRRANGEHEDPSKLLGMGSNERIGGIMSDRYPGYDSVGATRRMTPRAALQSVRVSARAAAQKAAPATKAINDSIPGDYEPEPYTLPGAPESFDGPDPFERAVDDSDFQSEDENDNGDWEVLSGVPATEVRWTVNKTPSGWQGLITIPLTDGRSLLVSRVADSKPEATKKAISAASNVLESPLAKMLIPPQAQAALRVLQSPTAQKAAMVAFNAAKKLKFW